MRLPRQAQLDYLSTMNDQISDTTELTPPVIEGSEGAFSVHLSNFDGPFDLLLQLISRHKMDVTEIALSLYPRS